MIIKNVVVGPLDVNCYILGCEDSRDAVIIDPGDDADEIIKVIESEGMKPSLIINTHAHFDHVGGVSRIQEHYKIDFLLHEGDLFLLESVTEQSVAFGLSPVKKPDVTRYIQDGDKVPLGNKFIKTIHTPGHSPGCVCYQIDDHVFVGDTIFASSVGRTDLPGGSHDTLIRSIKEKLFPLGDNVKVYPGHGPSTTIENERKHNPFLT